MSYQILYFNDAKKVISSKRMGKMVNDTLQGIADDLIGSIHLNTTLKASLDDCGWRENPDILKIIDGRRYQYKGYLKRVAVEASLGAYEYILEGLFRLQIGFDKGLIDAGLLILPGNRSEKSPLGESVDLVKDEIQQLYPTISLPVAVALFGVGVSSQVVDAVENTTADNVTELPADFYENHGDSQVDDIDGNDSEQFDEIITEVAV